jgi:SAM-dependent methyltransferase
MRKAWPLEGGYHNQTETYYGRVAVTFGSHAPSLGPGSKILDWGCSRGLTTIELANLNAGCEVVGIEVRRYMDALIRHTLEQTSRDGRYLLNHVPPELTGKIHGIKQRMLLPKRVFIADGFSAPFRDGSFDAVYCMNSLYYVLNRLDDHRRFERFQQVIRLVKSGGYLMFSGGGSSKDLDSVFVMVMRKEDGEMVVKHVNRSDWRAKALVDEVLEACGRTFCSLE